MEISSTENLEIAPPTWNSPPPAQIGVRVSVFCNQGGTSQLPPSSGRKSPPGFPHVGNARGLEATQWLRKERNWRIP